VKAHGATLYCQLWHTGRMSHPGVFKHSSGTAARWIHVDSCNFTMHKGLLHTGTERQDKKDKTISNTQL